MCTLGATGGGPLPCAHGALRGALDGAMLQPDRAMLQLDGAALQLDGAMLWPTRPPLQVVRGGGAEGGPIRGWGAAAGAGARGQVDHVARLRAGPGPAIIAVGSRRCGNGRPGCQAGRAGRAAGGWGTGAGERYEWPAG